MEKSEPSRKVEVLVHNGLMYSTVLYKDSEGLITNSRHIIS
jgi:hypothetical protein